MPPRQSFPSHPRVRDAAALGFTSSLGPFAANGIMPGFHEMAEDYGVSFVAVQQSLTIYLFTYAFFSLVAGSFSDSYGRRPTFIGGMLLFAAASVGAAFSQSLWALYGWRLLQGIGAAVGQVVTQAIVRDNWSGPEAANVNGMIAFFFAAGRLPAASSRTTDKKKHHPGSLSGSMASRISWLTPFSARYIRRRHFRQRPFRPCS